MGLNVVGLQLRAEIILEEPNGETVLSSEACRRKPIQFLQPPLEVSATLPTRGCGPIRPAVVVVATANRSGEFRVVPEALFDRRLEKIVKGQRPCKLLDKHNQNEIAAFHDADYILAGTASIP
jgi:hypothetical protein